MQSESARAIALGLRFLLEIAALAALAYWGYHAGRTEAGSYGLAIAAPLAASAAWGLFVAPKGSLGAPQPLRFVIEVAIFGVAALALISADKPGWALAFVGLVAIDEVLLFSLGEA